MKENKHKQFKPFDKILVKDNNYAMWMSDFYQFYNEERGQHLSMLKDYWLDDFEILPYEGNEHLVGTNDEPKVPLSEKETQDAYWANCSEEEKKNLRSSYNEFYKNDKRGRAILEQFCGKHNLQVELEEDIKLEEGEWLIANDREYPLKIGHGSLGRCIGVEGNTFVEYNPFGGKGLKYNYAIRLKDFNPNDMEETRKHILYVRNGKIIRYKE